MIVVKNVFVQNDKNCEPMEVSKSFDQTSNRKIKDDNDASELNTLKKNQIEMQNFGFVENEISNRHQSVEFTPKDNEILKQENEILRKENEKNKKEAKSLKNLCNIQKQEKKTAKNKILILNSKIEEMKKKEVTNENENFISVMPTIPFSKYLSQKTDILEAINKKDEEIENNKTWNINEKEIVFSLGPLIIKIFKLFDNNLIYKKNGIHEFSQNITNTSNNSIFLKKIKFDASESLFFYIYFRN